MVRPHCSGQNTQRPPVEWFGISVVALDLVKLRQVVEAGGQALVLFSELPRLANGSLELPLGLGVATLLVSFHPIGGGLLPFCVLGIRRRRQESPTQHSPPATSMSWFVSFQLQRGDVPAVLGRVRGQVNAGVSQTTSFGTA